MYKPKLSLILLIFASLSLAACGGSTPSTTDSEPTAAIESTIESTAQADEPATQAPSTQVPPPKQEDEIENTPLPLEPQRIEFESEDGTALVGKFWPGPTGHAPGVLLFHQLGRDKESWDDFAPILQNRAVSSYSTSPHTALGYNVFAIDFRGHGESEGSRNDRAGMVADAQAALALFRTLPGVDPEFIILIGTSIGADAAVDACGEGCIAAISLSPGGYLGIDYTDSIALSEGKPILCAASENDNPSPDTCREGQAAATGAFDIQIYEGRQHGIALFDITDQEPFISDLIITWMTNWIP